MHALLLAAVAAFAGDVSGVAVPFDLAGRALPYPGAAGVPSRSLSAGGCAAGGVQDPARSRGGRSEPLEVGDVVPDLPVIDIRSQRRHLSDLGTPHALVLFFVTKDCPMVGRVLPAVGALAERYAAEDVTFVGVNVGRSDTVRDMGTQALSFDQSYPFVKDPGNVVQRTLGVERTTTAVVLDADRRLRYRGRVDDRVLYAHVRDEARREDLALAIDAVLAGREVEVPATPVEGCKLSLEPFPAPEPSGRYTFHRDIEPLLQRRCQECHRDGGAAPFPLATWDDVADHAEMIEEVVERGRMPPWHASDAHGTFVNRRALGAEERRMLVDWLRSGLPVGDPDDAPPPRAWPKGPWRIGEPDLVLEVKAPVRIPAEGVVPYLYLILPYRFAEDTWVEAVEILPENPRVLHHANLAWFDPARGFSQDGFVTGYVPGGDPLVLDAGTAMPIPGGSVLGLQAHYVTTGKPETDRLRVGLRFPRVPVTRRAEVLIVTDTGFAIPPGATGHRVAAKRRVRTDSTVIGLFAHMHLRGRDMTFVAHRPGEPPDTLLMIPNYDFDWQSSYRCPPDSVRLPQGTVVEVVAHFDNSAFNPFNPDPSTTVRFGQQTFEEMMYGFVFVTADEPLDLRVDPATGRVLGDR